MEREDTARQDSEGEQVSKQRWHSRCFIGNCPIHAEDIRYAIVQQTEHRPIAGRKSKTLWTFCEEHYHLLEPAFKKMAGAVRDE